MTDRNDREQQQAELLWRYMEELKQTDNPREVQFVAVTSGECAEVVGLMEIAAEAYALARSEAAPHCRREAVRRRLQEVMAGVPAASLPPTQPSDVPVRSEAGSLRLPGWLTAPLTGRSTGWAVAVAALVALFWFAFFRPSDHDRPPPPVAPVHCREAVAMIPSLLAGTLDVEKSRALWAHLNRCESCLEIYEAKWAQAHSSHRPAGQSQFWWPRPLRAPRPFRPDALVGQVSPEEGRPVATPVPRLVSSAGPP